MGVSPSALLDLFVSAQWPGPSPPVSVSGWVRLRPARRPSPHRGCPLPSFFLMPCFLPSTRHVPTPERGLWQAPRLQRWDGGRAAGS